jgi:hypothetical protein
MSDAEFRAGAEECRRLAARTIDPVEKQELQRIADGWLWLAQLAGATPEKPRRGHSVHEGTPAQATSRTAKRDSGSYDAVTLHEQRVSHNQEGDGDSPDQEIYSHG